MPDSTIGKFAALIPSIAVFFLGVGCGTLPSPEETESSPDFALWIVDQLGATVSSYNPASGELFDLNLPLDENVDPSDTIVADGKIVVTDFTSGKVLSYYQQQQQTLYENSAEQISIRIEEPCAIQHVDNMLWVLGNDSRNIVSVNPHTGDFFEILTDPYRLKEAHDFVVTESGFMWLATSVISADLGMLQLWDMKQLQMVDHTGFYGEIEQATALLIDEDSILVADFIGNQVVRYDTDTRQLMAVELTAEDGLFNPVSMQKGLDGKIYVLDRQGLLRFNAKTVERIFEHDDHGFVWPRNLVLYE